MCWYTYHHYAICGHIARFTFESCVEVTNSLRDGNPRDCLQIKKSHDLLNMDHPNLCLKCEVDSRDALSNQSSPIISSSSASGKSIPLEGTDADIVPFRVKQLEMNLERENDMIVYCETDASLPESQSEPRGRRRRRSSSYRRSESACCQEKAPNLFEMRRGPTLAPVYVPSMDTSLGIEDIELIDEEPSDDDPGYDAGDDDDGEEEESSMANGRSYGAEPLCFSSDMRNSPFRL